MSPPATQLAMRSTSVMSVQSPLANKAFDDIKPSQAFDDIIYRSQAMSATMREITERGICVPANKMIENNSCESREIRPRVHKTKQSRAPGSVGIDVSTALQVQQALAALDADSKDTDGKARGAHDSDGVAQMVAIPPLIANGPPGLYSYDVDVTGGANSPVATPHRAAPVMATTAADGKSMQGRDVLKRDLDEVAQMLCPVAVEPMSIGSLDHRFNTCKPCIFWTRGVCAVGRLCKYCHHLHTGNSKLNPLRRARARARQQALENSNADEPQLMVWSSKGGNRKLVINL